MKNSIEIIFSVVTLVCVQPGASFAGSTESLAKCASETNVFVRVGCYSEIAAAEGDPEICGQIKDHFLGYANCISEVAMSKRDAVICEHIGKDHPKGLCIIKVGQITGDYSYCASIGTASWRSACEAKGAQSGAAN